MERTSAVPDRQADVPPSEVKRAVEEARSIAHEFLPHQDHSDHRTLLLQYDAGLGVAPASVSKLRGGERASSDFPLLSIPDRAPDAARWLMQLDRESAIGEVAHDLCPELSKATADRPDVFVPALGTLLRGLRWPRIPVWRILEDACLQEPALLCHLERELPHAARRIITYVQRSNWNADKLVRFASVLPVDKAQHVFARIDPDNCYSESSLKRMEEQDSEETISFLSKFPDVCDRQSRGCMAMSAMLSTGVTPPSSVRTELLQWLQSRKSRERLEKDAHLFFSPDDRTLLRQKLTLSSHDLLSFLRKRGREYASRRMEMRQMLHAYSAAIPVSLHQSLIIIPPAPTLDLLEWMRELPKRGFRHPGEVLVSYRSALGVGHIGHDVHLLALALTRQYTTLLEAFSFVLANREQSCNTEWTSLLRPPAGSSVADQVTELRQEASSRRELRIVMGIHCAAFAEAAPHMVNECCETLEKEWTSLSYRYPSDAAMIPAARVLARYKPERRLELLRDLRRHGSLGIRNVLEIAYAPLLYPPPGSRLSQEGGNLLETGPVRTTRWHVLSGRTLPEHPSLRAESRALYDALQRVISDALDRNVRGQSSLQEHESALLLVLSTQLPVLQSRSRLLSLLGGRGRAETGPPQEEIRTAISLVQMSATVRQWQQSSQGATSLKHLCLDQRWIEKGAEHPIETGMPPAVLQFLQKQSKLEAETGVGQIRRTITAPSAQEYDQAFRTELEKRRAEWLQKARQNRREFLENAGGLTAALAIIGGSSYLLWRTLNWATSRWKTPRYVDTGRPTTARPSFPRADGSMPHERARFNDAPSAERLQESPAAVGQLSRPLTGRDQYLFFGYSSTESKTFFDEHFVSEDVRKGLAAMGPAEAEMRGQPVSLALTNVENGSLLALPLGGRLGSCRFEDHHPHRIDRVHGIPVIKECRGSGPYRMEFWTAPETRLHAERAARDLQERLPRALRPLLETTIPLERLPRVLQDAVAEAKRGSAAAGAETLRKAVSAFLTYDDTSGPAYEAFRKENVLQWDHPGHPYLEFICTHRRGACGQFARLLQELLRHAGIPSIRGNCLWAQRQTITSNDFHQVAIALLPDTNGQLVRIPLESTNAGDTRREELAGSVEQWKKQKRSEKQERGVHPDALPLIVAVGAGIAIAQYGIPRIRAAVARLMERRREAAVAAVQEQQPAAEEAGQDGAEAASAQEQAAKPSALEPPKRSKRTHVPPRPAATDLAATLAAPTVIHKPPPPPFDVWWPTLVHRAYRESVNDPAASCPDLSSCLLYGDIRERILRDLAASPYDLPPSHIDRVIHELLQSATHAKRGAEELGWFLLEKPC